MYELDLLCFAEPFRFDMASMRRFALQRNAIVVVASAGDRLAGFVIVHATRRGAILTGYIATLDVHPDFRRQSLATRLMDDAQQLAIEAGVGELRLHVFVGNESAIPFYECRGFTRVGLAKSFYGDGVDAWVYVNNLREST